MKQEPWDLSTIHSGNLAGSLKIIEKRAAVLEKWKTKLTPGIPAKTFLQLLKEIEDFHKIGLKTAVYAQLRFSENANDQKALAEMSTVETALTAINNRLLFFSLWFKDLPDKKATELIKVSEKYHYYLEMLRKNKRYTLKEEEEKIINIKDTTGASALDNIYNLLTSNFIYQVDGKKRTQEEMVTFVRSSSPKVRETAYRALLTPYKNNKEVIGEIYKNIINDWREENVTLRGYKSPISVRNVVNDIPDEAVEALLTVCEKNQSLFHRFFEIKRKRLGLKKLRRFDLYAPLEEEKENIPYEKGLSTVLETFDEFSAEFGLAARKIVEARHIHSTVYKGKRSGAFCCSVTTEHPPYVFLSYTEKYRDVSTLAHELGHGVHAVLASIQTEFTHEACLPLAETASIFSEMLLSEKMMKDNPKAAKEMLFTQIDNLYASITRQAGFVMFEKKAHQMMKEGKTIDEMSTVYLADLKKQLGPKVDVDEIFAYEWAYIPHIFHTPFYCYAYAFGNLLTLALYEMYKEKGSKFVPKIIEMLSKGGGESPLEITKAVGVDITSEKFWQKGFDVIEKMIKKVDS
ncbi:oligoendopeptidase F [Candidatus Woesearchaeota archaeon CG10_big_fil_rev_8_21_14_0_10_45_16]|nr:MAG: oligoendopeptidase F [Candidatus Woesearchaeota archaeon CG10_big_fil_rev_8_21_14_0_10_45_16]